MLKKTCLPPRPCFHQNPFTKTMFSPRTIFSPDTVFSIKKTMYSPKTMCLPGDSFSLQKKLFDNKCFVTKNFVWSKMIKNCQQLSKESKMVQKGPNWLS